MTDSNKLLKLLIEGYIEKNLSVLLKEQEEDSAPEPAADTGGSDDTGGLDLDLGGGELDADTGDAGGDLDAGGEGGDLDLGDGEGGEDGLDGEGGDDLGGDDFGGGGGFGGGGFGGGGGGGFGDDSDSDAGGEEGDAGEAEPEEEQEGALPTDPIQGTVDDVLAALEQTQNPQDLLNVAKASIQDYFQSFDEAIPVVDQLKAENNKILNDVAQRLSLFLTGNL